MAINMDMDNEKKISTDDAEACCEKVASQEEVYLETTEEELRADLNCEPATAEQLRTNRDKLERDWESETINDRCK